jgi:hypothetical protein
MPVPGRRMRCRQSGACPAPLAPHQAFLAKLLAGHAIDSPKQLLQSSADVPLQRERPMGRKVHWRHLTTQVAIMSVVFHAIMAAIMLSAPLAMAAPGPGTTAHSSMIICTGTSLERVSFGENAGESGKQSPAPCPICDGIGTSAFLLETAQTALIGRLVNPEVLRPANELRPSSIACLSRRNRGPPALA